MLIEIVRFPRTRLTLQQSPKFEAGEVYAAWIFTSNDIAVVDLGPANRIDEAVRSARAQMQSAPPTIAAKGEPEAEKEVLKPLTELSRLVIEPLLPYIQTSQTWIISPDGLLWLTPWAALPLPEGKFCIEKYSLQFVVTGRDLVTANNTKVKKCGIRKFCLETRRWIVQIFHIQRNPYVPCFEAEFFNGQKCIADFRS